MAFQRPESPYLFTAILISPSQVMQTREKLKTLSIYYQNVRSLRTKDDTFSEGVVLSDYDVYCITETWLLSDISSYELFCDSYSIFRRDRNYGVTGQKYGGGVLTAIRNNITAVRHLDLESYEECVWLEVKTGEPKNLLIGNYYIPPSLDSKEFEQVLISLSEKLDPANFNVIIVGDFNVPGTWWSIEASESSCRKGNQLLNCVHYNDLYRGEVPSNVSGNALDVLFTTRETYNIAIVSNPIVSADIWHVPFSVKEDVLVSSVKHKNI